MFSTNTAKKTATHIAACSVAVSAKSHLLLPAATPVALPELHGAPASQQAAMGSPANNQGAKSAVNQ